MSKAKAQRKAAKRLIETAPADAPVALSLAAIYLRLEYQSAWRLKARGVLGSANPTATTGGREVLVRAGDVVQYRWRQLARTPSAPEHLHRDLIPTPQPKDPDISVKKADDDDLLTLDEVAQYLGCSYPRAEELAKTQAIPVQWYGGRWMCRVADVRQYRKRLSRPELPGTERTLPR